MTLSVIRLSFVKQNDNRMTPHPIHILKQIVNRMGVSSGCHLQNKMTTKWHPIRFTIFFFKMWTRWGVIRFIFAKWQSDDTPIRFIFWKKNDNQMAPHTVVKFSNCKSRLRSPNHQINYSNQQYHPQITNKHQ